MTDKTAFLLTDDVSEEWLSEIVMDPEPKEPMPDPYPEIRNDDPYALEKIMRIKIAEIE